MNIKSRTMLGSMAIVFFITISSLAYFTDVKVGEVGADNGSLKLEKVSSFSPSFLMVPGDTFDIDIVSKNIGNVSGRVRVVFEQTKKGEFNTLQNNMEGEGFVLYTQDSNTYVGDTPVVIDAAKGGGHYFDLGVKNPNESFVFPVTLSVIPSTGNSYQNQNLRVEYRVEILQVDGVENEWTEVDNGNIKIEQFKTVNNLNGDSFTSMNRRALGYVGYLQPENVSSLTANDTNLVVKVVKNTNKSGQFRGTDWFHHGEFEADIKLPDNDGLLNGFFLYSNHESGKDNEIDIEMVKRGGQWRLLLNIYNPTHPNVRALNKLVKNPENSVNVYKAEIPMSFDPSEDFNNYKIVLNDDYVGFVVNGVEVARWNESFHVEDTRGMRLHSGTFYAWWLDKDSYKQLTPVEQASLKSNGYKAYDYIDGLEDKVNGLFSRPEDSFMETKNIKITTFD